MNIFTIMSKRIIKRFASVCPEAIDENFLSFLEPHSSFNVVSLSTNNQTSSLCSPKDYKTVTQRNDFSLTSSCKTSPKQKYLLKNVSFYFKKFTKINQRKRQNFVKITYNFSWILKFQTLLFYSYCHNKQSVTVNNCKSCESELISTKLIVFFLSGVFLK